MSNISVNTITDASGGSTASINGLTPQASNMQPHNLIINGAMTVAQRGTSVAGLGNGDNGYHTIDRYRFSESGSPTGEFTMSQSTDAPDGFGYSMKFDCTTADTSMASGDRFQVSTRIEGQNCQQLKYGTSDAQSLLLSFWVKSSKTGTYCIGVVQPDNGAISFVREYTVSSANTWEYKTLTIDGDTSGVISNGNGNGLELGFALAAGTDFHSTAGTWTGSYEYATSNQANLADSTSNTWQITGVQLEAGSTASSFAYENYADTLQKCQRYLPAFRPTSAEPLGIGFCPNTTLIDVIVNFQVPARVPTTGIITSAANTFVQLMYAPAITAVTFQTGGATATTIRFTTSGVAGAQANGVRSTGASTYILFTGCEL